MNQELRQEINQEIANARNGTAGRRGWPDEVNAALDAVKSAAQTASDREAQLRTARKLGDLSEVQCIQGEIAALREVLAGAEETAARVFETAATAREQRAYDLSTIANIARLAFEAKELHDADKIRIAALKSELQMVEGRSINALRSAQQSFIYTCQQAGLDADEVLEEFKTRRWDVTGLTMKIPPSA
jgi:hypothetical protein